MRGQLGLLPSCRALHSILSCPCSGNARFTSFSKQMHDWKISEPKGKTRHRDEPGLNNWREVSTSEWMRIITLDEEILDVLYGFL